MGIEALKGSGEVGSEPSKQLIEHYANDALLDAIAFEQRKGRFLFVVTTNLDAQRAVNWNMTRTSGAARPVPSGLDRLCLDPRDVCADLHRRRE